MFLDRPGPHPTPPKRNRRIGLFGQDRRRGDYIFAATRTSAGMFRGGALVETRSIAPSAHFERNTAPVRGSSMALLGYTARTHVRTVADSQRIALQIADDQLRRH